MTMITVVKFIDNTNEDSDNRVISRTLGKIGVFNSRDRSMSLEQTPQQGEFWRVEVVKEVVTHRKDGSSGGCFVLKPLSKVGMRDEDNPDIDKLVPGGYETELFGASLVIVPNLLGFNWIIEKDLRHHLRDQYFKKGIYQINSFVVSLNGNKEWVVEEPGAPSQPTTIYSGT